MGTVAAHEKPCHHNLRDLFAGVVEARIGKIPFSGRYHGRRRLEDDYRVSQTILGVGYNGEVRMARSISQPGQRFAVKSFRLSSLKHGRRTLLQAEVQNYLSIDHPHITRLHDVYESKHELHLVMECMEGGELFHRATEKKQFPEQDASDAVRQMLLALNYIHSHGIVHRDIKLENFMYDKKGSGHLKLIDFGFSKMLSTNGQDVVDSALVGTVSYVAPEILKSRCTSQCDLWSLGVICFILLAGYMPFDGPESTQIKNISRGEFTMRPGIWNSISPQAKNFVLSLLAKNPSKRLTAQKALEHIWIANNQTPTPFHASTEVVKSLRQFGNASRPWRCCMEMIAWSLSNDDRANVRNHFLLLDTNHQGTITLGELRDVMVDKLHLADEHEALRVFQALDYNKDQEIHYSDFLAAMVTTHIDLNDDLLKSAFRRFDADDSGFITMDNLRGVLGTSIDGEEVESFMSDVDIDHDGRISFTDFSYYLRRGFGQPHRCIASNGSGENIGSLRCNLNSLHSFLNAKSRRELLDWLKVFGAHLGICCSCMP